MDVKEIECESMNSILSTSLGSRPLYFKNFFEVPGCSYNASGVLDENPSLHNSQLNKNHLTSTNVQDVLQNKQVKKDFYFYQAMDGQHIYLSAVNIEMLESMFGSLENSPLQIEAIVIEKQCLSMTETLRKRYRFLLHLPITTVFEWVEIDLTNIVNQETLFIFKSNLDERKAKRDRRARDEQRFAKRIEEKNNLGNNKMQSPPPEWHNRDLFPECGYDPFADKSMIPLTKSIGITPTQELSAVNTSNGSPSSLSFAKALLNENTSNNCSSDRVLTNASSQWPVLGSRPNSISMNDVLEDAIANMNLHDGFKKSKNKKKKRSKYEPIF